MKEEPMIIHPGEFKISSELLKELREAIHGAESGECPNCHNRIFQDWKYCPNCAERLSKIALDWKKLCDELFFKFNDEISKYAGMERARDMLQDSLKEASDERDYYKEKFETFDRELTKVTIEKCDMEDLALAWRKKYYELKAYMEAWAWAE